MKSVGCKSHAYISVKKGSFVVDFVPIAPVFEVESPSCTQKQLQFFLK